MRDNPLKVLFVCTGNSCRSPMAEGLLKKRISSIDHPQIMAGSAGTHPPEGRPPTTSAVDVCTEHGIDISNHRAERITRQHLVEYDIILTMEKMHKIQIKNMDRTIADKVSLLTEFGPDGKSGEIEDPIGSDITFYRRTFQILNREIKRILPILEQMAEMKI